MKRDHRIPTGGSLAAIYERVDAVRMCAAERTSAKAALAQADALAGKLLAFADFVKRLMGAHTLRPTSAHG
jgi:hypothetical protein